ncbi:hypothetical protein NQ318_021973 [Aromia moschata]|uniref:Uncharacterized protein n=1 Tax=Aromia moschata TaxID=1265417 RepID=A0AAV8Z7S3_9CUCU|nr:hypothetical protein NQ318_021973 [Aromia moschata]
MPGPLLIARKNGRPVRTYGVNQVDVCNMKFTFICIVVVVSCSVSASGDLEIYPGVKFDLNTEERRSRLENYEVPEIFPEYKDNTWKNIPFDDYPDIERKEPPVYHLTLPERLRQIEEVIDYEKAQLSRHGNHHSKHRYEFGDAYDRLKDKALKNFGLGFPNTQILDDVRMYPQEDDFTFNNDDVDEPDGIQNVFEQPSLEERERMFQENKHVSFNNVRSSDIREELLNSAHHQEHDNAKMASEEEFPTGSFKNVKVVDDPTEFAYAPPDPRFYEKPDTSSKIGDAQQTADKTAGVGSSVSGKFKIKSRSDQNLLEYDDDDAEDLKFHNGNGETSGRSSVDVIAVKPSISDTDSAGVYIIAVVAGISAAATVGLIAVGIGWYNRRIGTFCVETN